AFVAKLNAAGSAFVFATYIGGSSTDLASALDLDATGGVFVTGATDSADFPVVAAFRATKPGLRAGFLAHLDASRANLLSSTYLGGTGNEQATGLAVDPQGNAYVAGNTSSTTFPTKSPFQAALAGFFNGCVAKYTASGALVYSTYFGPNVTSITGIAVNAA